ncbi:MAG: YciI family protein [Chloroflexales bacterium]|nr:YciI family protein [Chloroflexales bacterium]
MRYITLIYGNEAAEASFSPEEQQAQFAAHIAYAQELREKGVMKGGDPLLPTSAATTVRVRDSKALTTHGPFAETAEQLGGYYVIECANLDEALAWAAKNPSATYGSIEVRPVMEF